MLVGLGMNSPHLVTLVIYLAASSDGVEAELLL